MPFLADSSLQEGIRRGTNYYECEAVCPKEIKVSFIAKMNREFLAAKLLSKE